ncbi:MAG: hypothetical protein QNJ47_23115 [Nostocaceae cyanobacterium]|nr:hypothetical protein [Nostocaceae cyanobacterium]
MTTQTTKMEINVRETSLLRRFTLTFRSSTWFLIQVQGETGLIGNVEQSKA